jgi:hypothetical protein
MPSEIAVCFGGDCPVVKPDSHTPIPSYFLQMERGVMRIYLQQREAFVRQGPYLRRKLVISGPKGIGCEMTHTLGRQTGPAFCQGAD